MKKIHSLSVILCLFISCENSEELTAINLPELSIELGGTFQTNQLKIQSTEDLEIMVLRQPLVKSNIYELSYVLQMENSDIKIRNLSSSQSILFEKAILIESESKWIFIGLNIEENTLLIKKIEDKVGEQNISSYLGYGFSQIKGEWPIDSFIDQKSAFSYLAKFNKSNHSAKYDGGGSGSSCTSGGIGSSSCSTGTEIGPIGTSCSVSCQTGYYACCKSSNTTCSCIKETSN